MAILDMDIEIAPVCGGVVTVSTPEGLLPGVSVQVLSQMLAPFEGLQPTVRIGTHVWPIMGCAMATGQHVALLGRKLGREGDSARRTVRTGSICKNKTTISRRVWN